MVKIIACGQIFKLCRPSGVIRRGLREVEREVKRKRKGSGDAEDDLSEVKLDLKCSSLRYLIMTCIFNSQSDESFIVDSTFVGYYFPVVWYLL